MITIPATALFDVLKDGKAYFYDEDQYKPYKLTVSDEPRFDTIETENEDKGRNDLTMSKTDFMKLMLDRHVKFEYSFIRLKV